MGEMISNAKLFIDYGPTQGGSAGGAIWLQFVEDFKVTDDRSVEVKKAMGVIGGAGFKRTQGGGTIAITETRQDDPQVRWRRLMRDKKVFMMALQDENGGIREKWFSCTVSKVDRSSNADGDHTDEIEIKFLSSEESA